jgi:GGDEF domain-containing protein
VSIGYVTRTINASTLDDDLVGIADLAMLQAKEQGRDQSVMAAPVHCTNPRITCSSAEV